MENLSTLIKSEFRSREIDLSNNQWHLGLPNTGGWYFIKTNAPITALTSVSSPPSEYENEDGEMKKCRNYDIRSRTNALLSATTNSTIVINSPELRPVYSGMAKNILNRAREHTFTHKGTAGLALATYESLKSYKWYFHYIENTIETVSPAHKDTVLKLGEQMWRSVYGWPLLCSS